MKKCSRCKQELPLDSFSKDKHNPIDGYQGYCKICQSAYYKGYNAARKAAKAQVVVTSKVCGDCGLKKPASQFGKRSVAPDKLNLYCKPCWRIRCNSAMKTYYKRQKEKR